MDLMGEFIGAEQVPRSGTVERCGSQSTLLNLMGKFAIAEFARQIGESNMVYDYEWFKQKIYGLTEIDLGSYKERQMKRRIESLMRKNGYNDYEGYVDLVKDDQEKMEEFVRHITINVSEFYRNPNQWKVVEEKILPHLMEKRGRRLRIWSSACSNGEEPYTMIMMLHQKYPTILPYVELIATDVDRQALKKAKEGVYQERSLKNLPEDVKKRFFERVDGHSYQITDEVKSHVSFRWNNLLEDGYPDRIDLVLCRNVLIYFTEEAKRQIYQQFSEAQPMDGVLFIGSTEQIVQCEKYGYHSLGSFFYVKK